MITKRIKEVIANRKKNRTKNCKICKGSGYQREIVCKCIFDAELDGKMALSNIPVKFWDLEIKDFINNEAIQRNGMKYIDNIDLMHEKGIGIYMEGTSGLGKSMVASIVLKNALRKGYKARFTSLAEVVTSLTNTWGSPEKRKEFERDIVYVDFLVIDDLGKEYQDKRGLVDAVLDTTFRERSNNLLPTILTANASMDEVGEEKVYGEYVRSLFKESLLEWTFTGEDWRESRIAPTLEKLLK